MNPILDNIIDVVCLFEIIEEEQDKYFSSELDEDTKKIERDILQARNLKKKYLTLLN